MKGFKAIEGLSLQLQANSDKSVGTAADDSETNKSEMNAHDEVTNRIENESGPELPLPISNLFQAWLYLYNRIIKKTVKIMSQQ